MMVVSDIEDVFLPIAQEVIFRKYSESQAVINTLLEKLPTMFQRTQITESALGAALKCASLALVICRTSKFDKLGWWWTNSNIHFNVTIGGTRNAQESWRSS